MWRIKAELMLNGLRKDFFGYGTIVTKEKNGKYKVIVDGETLNYTLHQLAEEFDQLDNKEELIDLLKESF